MSDDNVIVHRSGGVLRRRASTLNALAFALLATPLVVGALSAAWWTSALQAPTRSQMVLMIWVGAAGAAMAAGGMAFAVGGAVLHAFADSQDAATTE
jgi:hypothetical protein